MQKAADMNSIRGGWGMYIETESGSSMGRKRRRVCLKWGKLLDYINFCSVK